MAQLFFLNKEKATFFDILFEKIRERWGKSAVSVVLPADPDTHGCRLFFY